MLKPQFSLLPISAAPNAAENTRRASRVVSMVHELHKAGYQQLRICAGYSFDGGEWRCRLMPTREVGKDGWSPISSEWSQDYVSSSGTNYFGWADAHADSARQLARKFVDRFPLTARESIGEDWNYAGWFTRVLGAAEQGQLPAFYVGEELQIPDHGTPLPPASLLEAPENAASAQGLIAHNSLKYSDLPPRGANYEQLWPFCLTFDGYRGGLRTIDDCFKLAEATEREGLSSASMERLRVTAFIRQRTIKQQDWAPPDPKLLESIRNVVEEIRRRLKFDKETAE